MNGGGIIAITWVAAGVLVAAHEAWREVRGRVDDLLSRRHVTECQERDLAEPLWRFDIDAPTDMCAHVQTEFATCLDGLRRLPVRYRREALLDDLEAAYRLPDADGH